MNWYITSQEETDQKVTDSINGFIDDVRSLGEPNPLNDKAILFDGVSFTLVPWMTNQGVYLSDMFSVDPGKGSGTRVLRMLTQKAQQYRINLYIFPKTTSQGDNYPDQRSLEKWYSKYGFRPQSKGAWKFDGSPLIPSGKFTILD